MNNSTEKESGNFIVFVAFACILLILTLGITLAIGFYSNETSRGTFGDMFGFANAVFTGLSFIGLLITIYFQRKDLNTQRKELQKQTSSLHVQNFENTFFQMLNLFNSIVESTEVTTSTQTQKSRKAFKLISEELEKKIVIYARKTSLIARVLESPKNVEKTNTLDYISVDDLNTIYDNIYIKYQDILGHYFRTYYHIIKLVDKTDDIDKSQYISIARAQLSNSEQILLFYNCLHKNGNEKFKPYVEEYALLHNMNINELPSIYYKEFYSKGAYENLNNVNL